MVKRFDWYQADDQKKQIKRRKPKTAALRKGLEPGKVLILLSGRFRGRRVVFLKQLKSGLLLVTGPYKVNGVPLRRVNQTYTITTSAKVDLKGVKVDNIEDEFFKKEKKSGKSEEKFFAEASKVTVLLNSVEKRSEKGEIGFPEISRYSHPK